MELGKRGYLENGGDIILVTGPSSAGKSSLIEHIRELASSGSLEIPLRVIKDADFLAASVAQAEREGGKGFYRKPGGGFVVTDQAIIDRAYRNFFAAIAVQEYTGYPLLVEWAGGVKKQGVSLEADFSYKTLGKIFMDEYARDILPRLRAVVNLVNAGKLRRHRNYLRKGDDARSQTVSDLYYINDFLDIASGFPEEKVFSVDNALDGENFYCRSRGESFYYSGRVLRPLSGAFLQALLNPFILLAAERRTNQPRVDHYGVPKEAFFNDYEVLKQNQQALVEAQKSAAHDFRPL